MRWLAILMVFASTAMAFPRLGLHDDFTRLVFDLEKGVSYTVSESTDTFTIRFSNLDAKAADTQVDSPQVASYQVVPGSNGATAYVRLKKGVDVKTWVMSDQNGRRLVVDVLSVAKPPAPKPTAKPRPQPEQAKTVVLDAGHGGIDSGAVGYVTEKAVTLDLALRVQRILQANGVQVVLTRDRDKHLSTDKATDLGLRAAMATSKRTLFASIHVNSAVNSAQGIEVYYFGNTIDGSLLNQVIRENGGGDLGKRLTRESQSAAERFVSDLIAQSNLKFSRQLASYVLSSMLSATGAVDRGVRSAPFYVIRNARIPAILVEVGFANHPEEGIQLQNDAYRQTLAKSIAKGILRFLDNGAASRGNRPGG